MTPEEAQDMVTRHLKTNLAKTEHWLHDSLEQSLQFVQQNGNQMTLYDWQKFTEWMQTAFFKPLPSQYPVLALAGEVGELANLVKKAWRESDTGVSDEMRALIAEEASDVLVYLFIVAQVYGFDLQQEFAKVYTDKIIPRLRDQAYYKHQS